MKIWVERKKRVNTFFGTVLPAEDLSQRNTYHFSERRVNATDGPSQSIVGTLSHWLQGERDTLLFFTKSKTRVWKDQGTGDGTRPPGLRT